MLRWGDDWLARGKVPLTLKPSVALEPTQDSVFKFMTAYQQGVRAGAFRTVRRAAVAVTAHDGIAAATGRSTRLSSLPPPSRPISKRNIFCRALTCCQSASSTIRKCGTSVTSHFSRGHRLEAAWLAVSLGSLSALGEGQKSKGAGGVCLALQTCVTQNVHGTVPCATSLARE
jgi:hypothetical protein